MQLEIYHLYTQLRRLKSYTGDPARARMKPEPGTTRAGTPYQPTMTDKLTLTVSPALPTFSEANPRAWFKLAESRFSVGKITDDDEKINRILEALPNTAFEKLAPWLDVQADSTMKYADLKTELLSYYTPSKQRRVQKILDLVTNQTDEKPSTVWRQIDSLQRDTEGEKIDLAWELWLHHLQPQVRVLLQESKDDKAILTKCANALQSQLCNATIMSATQRSDSKHGDRRNNHKRRDDKNEREQITNGKCWYHNRFGDRANKCFPGCESYVPPKNDKGSHQ